MASEDWAGYTGVQTYVNRGVRRLGFEWTHRMTTPDDPNPDQWEWTGSGGGKLTIRTAPRTLSHPFLLEADQNCVPAKTWKGQPRSAGEQRAMFDVLYRKLPDWKKEIG